ncbi:MAG: bifunctional alpha,alpha-trehalose-phosphate synthase (UDP-forming)/trehalose-phosphatase [Deltaproteobacteria bacterium]|nr:bifunctional alpha,alpha-trehalose-phosphate synthase (UDP-forming)/trehalose-phosphatase [Deltaproteobacteria bacterium]
MSQAEGWSGSGASGVVIVSNRLPFTIHRSARGLERAPSAGGLITALEPVLRKRGGTWVGWPGIELKRDEEIPSDGEQPYEIQALRLTDREITHYVHGFSNRTLWPLMHSLPARARFDRKDFDVYEQVNQRFANAIAMCSRAQDLVWIHDFHLMMAPSQVRLTMPDARLAFFLHIPFPPYDIFRLLPWDRELLRGMLDCNLIGFHVDGYAQNFLDCVERRLGSRVDRENMVVEHGDRVVQVGVFPIGIAYGDFERRARETASQPETQSERVVLGVDRLDYTKGIPERIRAFERLLELHPRHREKVVLLQLAVPSRSQVAEYRALKREIDELVGQVNGRFATATWSPIRYLYRSLSQDKLAAIYRDADIALVTPLRDGMNLVAKEYVASQVLDPGVLILSRLAGAAETMREALLVNPYNADETAEALNRAIDMEEPERRTRMEALRRREQRDDVEAWVHAFLSTAEESRAAINPLSVHDFEAWLGPYLTRPRLALFLDYDGTLTEICEHPAKALLSDAMRKVVEGCAARDDTDVAVISGRKLDNVAEMVGHPGLTYAGNHGLEIRGPDIEDFAHEDLTHYQARTAELVAALDVAEVHADGAWTEAKGPTLTYHYRGVPPDRWPALIKRAERIITAAGFQARPAHCALEARPPIGWDKGRAVLHVLRERYGPSWSQKVRVIYVGDDQTDEDAFRFLAGLAMTFRVGPADTLTAATRRLPNVSAVQALIEWLAQRDGWPLPSGPLGPACRGR